MKKVWLKIIILVVCFNCSSICITTTLPACKDIIAINNATEGPYNLLLKVRDPSRSGPQVLCIVPEGHQYSYYHPWTGNSLDFSVTHKYIGVATQGDTIPNIVKAGMILTDAGLAFGDADTMSNWINPTRYAWDDFDWIRLACESADSEEQAVELLTKQAVDRLHATAVSENLFLVGPEKGYVVEADAYRYHITEVSDVCVMSNYPKELWRTQVHKRLPIADSFGSITEQWVKRGRILRLNSLSGIKIVSIGEDCIIARQVPFLRLDGMVRLVGKRIAISLGERKTVGDYSVRLLAIDGNQAKISLRTVAKAWEETMESYIMQKYGSIKIQDLMNWSRLLENDVDSLRPMCEGKYPYESVAIYQIPEEYYNILSCGWFAPNHACSSIFVPFHIGDTDILDVYETGEAAVLCLELFNIYGNKTLVPAFKKVEEVFLAEQRKSEMEAVSYLKKSFDVSEFLTIIDTGMQEQAWITENLWREIHNEQNLEVKEILEEQMPKLWQKNYLETLQSIDRIIENLHNNVSYKYVEYLLQIADSICKTVIDVKEFLGNNVTLAQNHYKNAQQQIENTNYCKGVESYQNALMSSNVLYEEHLLIPKTTDSIDHRNVDMTPLKIIIFFIFIFCAIFITYFIIRRKRSN